MGHSDAAGPGQSGHHDLRILNAIRQIIRAVDIDSRKLAADHQITGPQLMCLLAIVEQDSTTAIEAAKRVHLSPSTLVGVLDRLESKGLIRRQRSTEDRREIRVSATSKGKALAVRTPFPLQYTLARAMEQLSLDEQDSTAQCLERLVDLMGAREMDQGPMLEIIGLHARQREAKPSVR
ncbi:MAG: MarR family transcriptional regulator [Planctomycetaceae bacterium]|nr:MarR family transcriptional regulator [Planctomycetaceae bacterium]